MVYRKEISVQGGHGGSGAVSFHREKFVPRGGPDGGDGGYGGNVIIIADANLPDLGSMQSKREFVAENGSAGASWRKRGKKGENLVIPVPVGTVVFIEAQSGEKTLAADLTRPGQSVLAAKGGRGGLGNARFATAVNQAPNTAGKGAAGEKKDIVLELRLITDICIVGQPNSGKSTLLAAISRAKPQIADYPFTTRQPVLGAVSDGRRDFIVAEVPALVEGSHLGKGLGNEFLRHVERARLLIYLLDGGSPTIAADFATLDSEIGLLKGLAQKAKIVAVNKIDLPETQASLPEIRKRFAPILSGLGVPVFYISALTGQAVVELVEKAMEIADQASRSEDTASQPQIGVFRPRPKK
jgi:GTP-binding protein